MGSGRGKGRSLPSAEEGERRAGSSMATGDASGGVERAAGGSHATAARACPMLALPEPSGL